MGSSQFLKLKIIILSLALAACAGNSESVNTANELFQQNKNEEAIKVLTNAAEDDYVNAQLRLARYYEDQARLEPANRVLFLGKARSWYQRAIRNGSALAEYQFGMLSCNEQVNNEASDKGCQYWLESAASKGNLQAQIELANRYFSQKGDSVALLNAEFWAKQAAPRSLDAAKLLDKIQLEKVRDMRGVEWIVEQNPESYTIQLNVFAEPVNAIDYAFNWSLNDAAIYQDKMGNYGVLIYVFDDIDSANTQIRQLPDGLKTVNTQAVSFQQLRQFLPEETLQQVQQQATQEQATEQQATQQQATQQQATQQQATQQQATQQQATQQQATQPQATQQQATQQQATQQQATQQQAQAATSQPKLTAEQQAYIEQERLAYQQLQKVTQPDSWFIEQQQAGRYSVILLSDVTPSQALRFLELTGLTGAYAYLERNGTIKLMAGAFDTQEGAKTEIQNLPETFMQFGPTIVDAKQLTLN